MKEHELYRLVRGKGSALAEWKGQTWYRYVRWYERLNPAQKFKQVARGPFPTPERARAIFSEEVNRRLAEGYEWASNARFGTGARAAAPEQTRSKPWPPGTRKPPVWLPDVPAAERTRVRSILEKANLAHRADDITTVLRPAIRFSLTTVKAPTRVTTRFGGAPDLPAGFTWPTNGKTPLAFVAQFRLDELTKRDLEGQLPEKGLLSAFAHLALDGSDDYGENGQLFYFPPASKLERMLPPHSAKKDGPTKTALATPSIVLTLPALHEKAYNSLRLDEAEGVRYDEMVLPAVRNARSSPKAPGAHQLLGWSDTRTPSGSEQLLGQIDSDRRFGFEVGDVETLRLWINSKKLAKGDFARTRFTVQTD